MRATTKRHVHAGQVKGTKPAEPAKVKAETHATEKKQKSPASHFAEHQRGHEQLHSAGTKTSKSIDFGEKALAGKSLVAQLEASLAGAVPAGYGVEVKKRNAQEAVVTLTAGSSFKELTVSIDSTRLRLFDGAGGAGPLGPPPEYGGSGEGSSMLTSVKLEDYVGKHGVDFAAATKALFRNERVNQYNGDAPTYV